MRIKRKRKRKRKKKRKRKRKRKRKGKRGEAILRFYIYKLPINRPCGRYVNESN